MCSFSLGKKIIAFIILLIFTSFSGYANDNLFSQARTLQREGKFDQAIDAFKSFLCQPVDDEFTDKEQALYSEALMQMMNTYQSKGEPETCISTLQEVFKASPVIQKHCLRDYYSVLGYALSRTERMIEAEQTMLKALTLPLHFATPERYFRDYAYAAAVFYSNSSYQHEVINWCEEALAQVELCHNSSGKQWVMAMLGSLYKRNGQLNKALHLFQQSKEEALNNNDDLAALNSLNTLIDLFLYWDIPEYANLYATEAIQVEKNMTNENPMVSSQTFINKGRSLLKLGLLDSVAFYTEKARHLCQSLPYNSGMVDVNLLNGTLLTDVGGDSLLLGIEELQRVTIQGTSLNRARAYHQLAQTFLKQDNGPQAEEMLDSLCVLLNQNDTYTFIHLDYQPILDYYIEAKNHKKVEQYVQMMLKENSAFDAKSLNYNLVESIVDLQTEKKKQELRMMKLHHTNQHLWLLFFIMLTIIVLSIIVAFLFYQKNQHRKQMKKADDEINSLEKKLNQSNAEKEIRAEEIKKFLDEKNNRYELGALTPLILQTEGEPKFRQMFELLYPKFIHRLREKVSSITPREELLSMLIVLKQDNKRIAEILAIAPRSVLMLRHRFRQKIGMSTEYSLEYFIEEILGNQTGLESVSKESSENQQYMS